jgi:hypothetical protein
MCGLIAIKTIEQFGFTAKEKDEFRMMMVLNSFRGSHSTGIAGVSSRDDGEVNLAKAIGSPMSLLSYDKADTFLNRIVTQFDTVIGHGRYATRGQIDAYNAHPYEEGHITLAHNGVIANYNYLRDHQKHKDIDVDSHLIARLFAENGVVDTLEKIEGAYVFIWYNANDQTLNVCRNNQRPLFIGRCEKRKTLMMASESETLIWNAMRNDTPLSSIDELPPYQIHTFTTDSLDAIVTEYRPYVPKPVVTYHKPTTTTENSQETSRGTKHKRQKLRVGVYDSTDDLLASTLEETVEVKVGDRVRFEIFDYTFADKILHIWGFNENIPTFKFKLSLQEYWSDEDILESMVVEAEIGSIYANMMTGMDIEVAYTAFVQDARLVPIGEDDDIIDKLYEQDDDMVEIMDCEGVLERISKHRLAELADQGCAWSQCFISNDDLKKPRTLLYHCDDSFTGIVCPDCARTYIDSMNIVH